MRRVRKAGTTWLRYPRQRPVPHDLGEPAGYERVLVPRELGAVLLLRAKSSRRKATTSARLPLTRRLARASAVLVADSDESRDL